MLEIQFVQTQHFPGKIPEPYPAARHIPEWFTNLSPEGSTEKRILDHFPPFSGAMTAGYIIPAPGDLRITFDYGFTPVGEYQFLAQHARAQYAGSSFAGRTVVKFYNPWIIVTPPDYVCLITAPINRFEMPFVALTGIVETGQYYAEVALPMICMMALGETYDVRRGTPMIQVIPFRREDWTSRLETFGADDRCLDRPTSTHTEQVKGPDEKPFGTHRQQ
jgi:hypothetical protein